MSLHQFIEKSVFTGEPAILAKHTARISASALALVLASGSAFALDPNALPSGGEVVRGDASIARSGNSLDVNQITDRTVIDWRSFNIGRAAQVNFNQPTADAIAVNRVNGSTDPTLINGRLTANGHVWVLNPNGVMFGAGAQVDVAGLVASTAELDMDRFMAGDTRLELSGTGEGAISNQGLISIKEGGLAAFVAPSVSNSGVIQARLGKVSLAAGEVFTLDLAGDSLVEIGLGAENALVQQLGEVAVEGGVIEISAKAAGGLVDSLVNLSGITSAASAQVVGGDIILSGGDVQIAGTLDVSGAAGGGSVDIRGDTVTTTAAATLKADGLNSGNGGVILAYADTDGHYAGSFSARGGDLGGDGGSVETSGKRVRVAGDLSVNTLAPHGETGSWSVDPLELTVIAAGGDGNSIVGADTIVTNLATTDVVLEAEQTINIEATIDSSAQANNNTLTLADENQDGALTVNLNADILLGENQVLAGEASDVNVADTGLIQNGVDVSAVGATVNVAAGTYDENVSVHVDGLTLSADAGATLTVGDNRETGFSISASNVTLAGMTITGPFSDPYTDTDWSDPANHNTAINLAPNLSGVTVSGNTIADVRTGISLGTGSEATVTGNWFDNTKGSILVRTDAATINGNQRGPTGSEWDIVFFGVSDGAYATSPHTDEAQYGADIMALSAANGDMWVLDRRYGAGGFLGNTPDIGNRSHVAVLAGSTVTAADDFGLGNGLGNRRQPLASLGEGIGAVVHGGVVELGAGTYTETVTVDKTLTVKGAQAGVDGRGRSGEESVLAGAMHITDAADGTVIDGLEIAEGARVQGSSAGVYIDRGAVDITVQNSIFSRSGEVDGDGYRGILTVSDGGQTGLVIQNNDFTGWATGVFLNPGAIGAQVLNNDFEGNFVGMSIDGPQGATVSGNRFAGNLFEGLGLGPGSAVTSATVSDNDFTANTTHIGLYTDLKVDVTSNRFDGILATDMTRTQLFALEDKIGHGLDAGFAGYVVTRAGNVYVTQDSGSIQRGHDTIGAGSALGDQHIINVAPGNYSEGNALVHQDGGTGGGQNFGLHLYHDYVLVQGIDGDGNVIADAEATAATVNAQYQTGFGAQHFVYGDGVTVTGLTFKPVDGGTNKTFEVIGDHFTMRNSVIDNTGNTTAINLYLSEFADQGKDVETFTIENNIFLGSDTPYYMVTFASGAGDDTDSANRIFSNNRLVGGNAATQTGIRFNGVVPGIAWLVHNVGAVTVENNIFSDLHTPVSSRGADLPNLGFDDIFNSNTFTGGAVVTYVGTSSEVRSTSVDLSHLGATQAVPLAAITRNLDDSVAVAQDGDTVVMSEGRFTLDSRLDIDASLTLSGQGESETVIDGSGISGYGIYVSVDDVSLSDFTFYGPAANAASSYGIKVSPGAGTQLNNFNIADVTIRGSGRAELDLNGVSGATISNVTADGRSLSDESVQTQGAGIQITDSEEVTLTGVTTLGNAWGGVALYQTNRFFDLQVNNINIDAAQNSFNEANGLYTEDESVDLDFGTLNLSGFTHTVRNDDFRDDGEGFTFYQVGEQTAIDFALALAEPGSSYIQGWTGTALDGRFTVGVNSSGDAMSIATAVAAAAAGSAIDVLDGTYNETVTADLRLDFSFGDVAVGGLVLNGANSTLRGTLSSDADGFTFSAPLLLTGDTLLTTTGGAAITTAAIDGLADGEQSLEISAAGPVTLGSLGGTTRLAATTVSGAGTLLNGSVYRAGRMTFNNEVTLTQASTRFDTQISAAEAGDITFNGDISGTLDGAQSVVFVAGSGTGDAASNGDVSLQNAGTELVKLGSFSVRGDDLSAATVWLASTYDALLTGNQVFTDETLNAGGDVTSTVGGNATGPIVSSGRVVTSVGGDASGSITAAGDVISAVGGDAAVEITTDGDVQSTVGGNVTGSIRANGSVESQVAGDATVVITAVTGSVVSTVDGDVEGTINAGGNIESVVAGDASVVIASTGGSVVSTVSGNVQGSIAAAGNVDNQVTGDASVVITATAGDVTSQVGGDLSGSIDAGGDVSASSGGIHTADISGDNVQVTADTVNADVTAVQTAQIAAEDSYSGAVSAGDSGVIVAETVDAELSDGSFTVDASVGTITGDPENIDIAGDGVVDVNGQAVIGTGEVDVNQIVVESFTVPETVVTVDSGEVMLSSEAIDTIADLVAPLAGEDARGEESDQPRVIVTGGVQRLGELFRQGYSAIVVDFTQVVGDEREVQLEVDQL